MEATFLAKKALFNIPKFLPQGPHGIQSITRVTRACLYTAYEHVEGSNAVAGGEGLSGISDAPRDAMYEAKHGSFATGEARPPDSTSSFAADTAKDGIKKAVEMAENVGNTAKKTLDGAWEAAKDTAQGIKEKVGERNDENEIAIEEDAAVDEVRKVDQLVDTQEYRIIEELKKAF